jgi:hypothetical protein
MTVARTYRISVDSLGFYFGSAAPFNGIVQAHNHGTPNRKGTDQQIQQDATRFQARPLRAIHHALIILKMLLHAEASCPQRRGYSPLGWRKVRTNQKNLRMLPNPVREQSCKDSKYRDLIVLQGWHRLPREGVLVLAYLLFVKIQMDKVQIRRRHAV